MKAIKVFNYLPETGDGELGVERRGTYIGKVAGDEYRQSLYDGFIARGGVVTDKPYPNAMFPQGPTLAQAKDRKQRAIDRKTSDLIVAGFDYSGRSFSMSANAQRNWAALGAAHALGLTSFPLTVSTRTEREYELADAAACVAFLTACYAYQTDPTKPLQWGRNLKDEVARCTTVAEVNAIVDPR